MTSGLVCVARAAHRTMRDWDLLNQPSRMEYMMNRLSKKHPPLRGKRMAICLALAKRPKGVTGLEALEAGGGIRLPAQILRLDRQGHRFRDEWERGNGSRYKRYWWLGYEDGRGGGDEG